MSPGSLSDAMLPTGTLTFLFSDIEGSTRLLQKLGDQYAAVLEDQREIFRRAIADEAGVEVDSSGDAFFAAFPRATGAVRAAMAIQRALGAHHWPEDTSLRVRMGLHTGEPNVTSTGYTGLDVHRAARICTAGHGGQVLLSETTRELVQNDLGPDARLRNLGEHRLKDLQRPQRLVELVIEGLHRIFHPFAPSTTNPTICPCSRRRS